MAFPVRLLFLHRLGNRFLFKQNNFSNRWNFQKQNDSENQRRFRFLLDPSRLYSVQPDAGGNKPFINRYRRITFLWILPLSLYLFSFILTFSKFYTPDAADIFRRLYKTAVVLVIIFFFHFKILSSARDNLFLIFSHCLFYFIFSVYCHGLLSARKPAPEKLTLFYLCLAVGGALGGVFNTFAAPYLFLSFMEYPFILAASLPFVLSSFSENKKDLIKNILLSAAAVLLFVFVPNFSAAVEKNYKICLK